MSKKTLAVVLVVLLIIAVGGVLFLTRDTPPPTLTIEPLLIPETTDIPVPETDRTDDMHFDDSSEETRIILSAPDDEQLNELLSDKVIRDDKIVDKPQVSDP